MELKPNVRFKLHNQVFLAPEDLKTLTLLYQPLLGVGGVSLFLTLNGFTSGEAYEHHMLLQIFDLEMKQVLQSRHHLEAVGLMEVYEQKDGYVYELRRPLSAVDFFNDGLLNAFLYLKVGSQDYARIKGMFFVQKPEASGEKVSKKFNEMFDTGRLVTSSALKEISGVAKESKSEPKLKSALNLEFLMSLLRQKGFDEQVLSPKLLELLNEMAFLYKLDAHELARVVFDAMDASGSVDFDKIKYYSRNHFRVMLETNQADNHFRDVNEHHSKVLMELQPIGSEGGVVGFMSQNPVDFLRFKAGGRTPVPADVKLVEWLCIDQKMQPGVVNVLVDYVLDYTEGKLPKQLVEKIAGEWQRKGISTVKEAFNQVDTVMKKSKEREKQQQAPIQAKPNLRRATRIEPTPEWLGKEYVEEEKSEADLQAIARIKEMKQQILNRSR